MSSKEIRPWGYFETLYEEDNFKLKRLVIREGEKISLQRHDYRSENWHVVSCNEAYLYLGTFANVTPKTKLYPGKCYSINTGMWHTAEAIIGDLEIVEYQYGEKVVEEDIHRLRDKYGRT